MKTTEKILQAIKQECEKQTKLVEINCFDKIARSAEIAPHRLPMYLLELQDRGYIRYSVNDNFIYLTRKGAEYVIPESGSNESPSFLPNRASLRR
jgi:hypothetical protein